MDNRTEYFLLLADLGRSTSLKPKAAEAVMSALRDELASANSLLSDVLVSDLVINYGDEFAGLFRRAAPLYDLVSRLRHALRELATFRFVVARGRVGDASGALREMGGPVFKRANDALRSLKTSDRFSAWMTGSSLRDQTLDALTNIAHAVIMDMTRHQYASFHLLSQDLLQIDIADRLGKTPQSVSLALKRAHGQAVIDAEGVIRALLREADQQYMIDLGETPKND
ncbi:MAG: hypothetical protein AAFQ67_03830 [Pseudomonadota bacterium]